MHFKALVSLLRSRNEGDLSVYFTHGKLMKILKNPISVNANLSNKVIDFYVMEPNKLMPYYFDHTA